jgi:hypothetical protein
VSDEGRQLQGRIQISVASRGQQGGIRGVYLVAAELSRRGYATSGEPEYVDMSEEEIQHHFVLEQKKRKALLEAYIEQLRQLAPPSSRSAIDGYSFHNEIERVSRNFTRTGTTDRPPFMRTSVSSRP